MGSFGSDNRDGNLATLYPIGRRMSIAETAEAHLRKNSFLALRNISCDFDLGVLTLRGCLPSYYLKQLAQETVAGVPGVERLLNEIEVVSSPRSDSTGEPMVSRRLPR